ncbi:MAG: IgGFc-binding protein [Paludibacteraceae bacterium]|nr:IgGFc-binding protein [Paludibacteraceae bacterium]
MNRLLLIISAAFLPLLSAWAQVDRDFWFAVPYLDDAHDYSLALGEGRICITSFDSEAHVTVSQPAITDKSNPFYFPTTTYTIAPSSSQDILIGSGNGALNRANNTMICPHGIHIESDVDVTVYYAQVNNNSEIYTLKGTNALGFHFLVPMQRTRGNGYGHSSIEVVATEPNTTVTVTTRVATLQYPAAGTYTVTLQAGEILTLRALNQSAASHLGGTLVTSDKPVAVNSTDDSVQAGGQDLVGEQLVPSPLAGKEYIALRHNGVAEELLLYTFPDAPITYTVNGGAAQTLAGGSFTTISLAGTDSAYYISADTTFVAFQVTSDGSELGGTVLPRLDCTGSREIAIRRRFIHQQFNILVKTDYINAFTINGAAVSLPFTPVSSAPEWSYCYHSGDGFFDTNGILRIRNTQSVFHLAILDYGNSGGTCSYGYFSGYNMLAMVPQSDKPVYLVGEQAHLSLTETDLFSSVRWTYPDGSVHDGASQTIPMDELTQSGWYSVSGISLESCPLSRDSYSILIHVLQPLRRDSTACQSDTFPHDMVILRDTVHTGHNMLTDTTSAVDFPCTSGVYDIAWQSQTVVTDTLAYQFDFEYSSSGTAPNIEVLFNDSLVNTVSRAIVRTTPKTRSFIYQPVNAGVLRMVIRAGGVPNNPVVTVRNMSLRPLLPIQDSVFVTVENCETPPPPPPPPPPVPTPCPEPVIADSQHVILCDTLMPYEWRGHLIACTGKFCDTVISRDTCDSLYFILLLDTVQCLPPEPPAPDTCLEVITQRWNDILGIKNAQYNGGHVFVSYQWYCNGQLMDGETRSYIYVPATFTPGDVYYAVMVEDNGQTWKACEFTPQHITYDDEGLVPVEKIILHGRLYIRRGKSLYSVQGQKVQP